MELGLLGLGLGLLGLLVRLYCGLWKEWEYELTGKELRAYLKG